jgi:hypothetical protein
VTVDPVGPADAFALTGCPVCQALPRIEAELVDGFCRQSFSDPNGRDRVLAVGGLCARHWWLVATVERAWSDTMLGTAELFADVLDRFGTHGAVARCPLCVNTEESMSQHNGAPLRSATGTGLATARAMLRPLGFTRVRACSLGGSSRCRSTSWSLCMRKTFMTRSASCARRTTAGP